MTCRWFPWHWSMMCNFIRIFQICREYSKCYRRRFLWGRWLRIILWITFWLPLTPRFPHRQKLLQNGQKSKKKIAHFGKKSLTKNVCVSENRLSSRPQLVCTHESSLKRSAEASNAGPYQKPASHTSDAGRLLCIVFGASHPASPEVFYFVSCQSFPCR